MIYLTEDCGAERSGKEEDAFEVFGHREWSIVPVERGAADLPVLAATSVVVGALTDPGRDRID